MPAEEHHLSPYSREASHRRSRFNFLRMFPDAVGWPVGWAVMQPDTILPAFVSRLGGGELGVGLIRGIYSFGVWLPSLWAARAVRGVRKRGPFVVVLGLVERIPMLVAAFAALSLGRSHPGVALTVFYLCWAVRSLAEGVNRPAYSQLLTESVRASHRGRFWGYSTVACALVAVPWSLWASGRLKSMAFPEGYVLLFLVGFGILTITLVPLWWVRERVAGRVHPDHVPSGLRSLKLLSRRPAFGYFTLVTAIGAVADMAAPFYVVHALKVLGAPEHYAALYSGAYVAAGALAAYVLGVWADRAGNRRALLCAGAMSLAAPLAAGVLATPTAFFGVFVLLGAGASCMALYGYNMLLEVVPPQEAAAYCGAHYGVVEPVRAVAPVLGALIVRHAGTPWAFGPAAIIYAAWLVLVFRMRDPRQRRQGAASGAPT